MTNHVSEAEIERRMRAHEAQGATLRGEQAAKAIIDDTCEGYTLCGCARHAIRLDGDPYAQHRLWMRTGAGYVPGECWSDVDYATESAEGIGVSAPEAAPLALDDPTGDDVARDAYRTTGGRTLDDVIEACREPMRWVIEGMRWGERRDPLPAHAHTSDTVDALSRTVEVVHTGGVVVGREVQVTESHATGIRFHLDTPRDPPTAIDAEQAMRFQRTVRDAISRAQVIHSGPVGVALEAPQPGVGYSFKLMPATSSPERMVSEAIARREAVATLQKIQEVFTSGLIEKSEAIAWARGALGGEALPPTLDTLDRPQDEHAVLPELAE